MLKLIQLITTQLLIWLFFVNFTYAVPQSENLLGKIEETANSIWSYMTVGVFIIIFVIAGVVFIRKRL